MQSTLGVPGIAETPQQIVQTSEHSHMHKELLIRPSGEDKLQAPQSESMLIPVPSPQLGNGDKSKLTCFKCGKVRHIANDPKCPQYKKPVQCQMFAVQVIDDTSESEQCDVDEPSEESEEIKDTELESGGSIPQEEHSDPDDHSDGSEGPQYEEYDGYVMPLEGDDSKVKYIWVSYEIDNNAQPLQSSNEEWEL
jgi:hypothetical protein